jgi:hypothetical protein
VFLTKELLGTVSVCAVFYKAIPFGPPTQAMQIPNSKSSGSSNKTENHLQCLWKNLVDKCQYNKKNSKFSMKTRAECRGTIREYN